VALLKSLFLNSLAQLIGKFGTALVTLFVSGIVARSLGVTGYGQFTIMTTYAAAFYAAADFGFNGIVLRIANGSEDSVKVHFQKLLGLRIVYATALIAFAAALLNFFPYSGELKVAAIVTSLTILTQAIYNCANLIFQFRLRYDLSAAALFFGSILNLALIFALAQGNINIILIAGTYVMGGIATISIAMLMVKSLIGKYSPNFDWREWKTLIAATLPVGLTLIFNLVYFRADSFILSFLKPASDVGIYGAAYKLFEVAITPPTFFMNALYPILIKKFAEDQEHFRRLIRYSIIGLAIISMTVALIGVATAPFIVNLVYGSKFESTILPFRLLFASLPIFYLSNLYMWLLILLKKQTPMFIVYMLGMLINISLNIYFIPHFTYIASSLITTVSETLILVCTFLLAKDWWKEESQKATQRDQ
jgi:O-antigen/teichoic acid export membrane protein